MTDFEINSFLTKFAGHEASLTISTEDGCTKFSVKRPNSEVNLSAFLKMAHPGFVIEQYVYHFLSQWRVGLQPSLKLDAKPNGEIAVSLNLTTSLPFNHNGEQCSTPLSRDSGRGSRRRRRVRRAAAAAESSRESHEARIPSQVESQENQCTLIENQPVDIEVVAESPLTAVSDLSIPPTSNLTQECQQTTDEEPALILPQDRICSRTSRSV